MTAVLKWLQQPYSQPPGFAWRLCADADTLALVGGAPCFNHEDAPGQLAYAIRDGGLWYGAAELTPYWPTRTRGRRLAETAKADVLATIEAHLKEIRP